MDQNRSLQTSAQRIVVKVGSSTLTRNGQIRPRKLGEIARAVCQLVDSGREIVLVSSGAVAIGSHRLGWTKPGESIRQKQAAAAVGQIGLSEVYRKRFREQEREVAQVLLTRGGLENRERFLNARHTLLELLRLGVVPIVNENDTVATDEIRFGDNDNLSAAVVNLIGAQLLIILTDVDGLYSEPPQGGRQRGELLDVVDEITPAIRGAAQDSASEFGRGGMVTKIEAAENAARSGAATVLCNSARPNALLRVAAGEPEGTLFLPGEPLRGRKHWLAFTARTQGELTLDEGAIDAVKKHGKSLLPAGIQSVQGQFGIGDVVTCIDDRGQALARGLVAYSSEELMRIAGRNTQDIAAVLGFDRGEEAIHRDDLVLTSE